MRVLSLTPAPSPSAVLCSRAPAFAATARASAVTGVPSSLALFPASIARADAARFTSTKRKRQKMMNKHKYEKRTKLMRKLGAKNVRSK